MELEVRVGDLVVASDEAPSLEVVRGPASALFGANAFSGVINIITKSVDKATVTMTAKGGSYDFERADQLYLSGLAQIGSNTSDFAAKFTGGDDEGVVHHAALVQIV